MGGNESQRVLAVAAFASRYPKALALGLLAAAKRPTALPKAGAKAKPERLFIAFAFAVASAFRSTAKLAVHFHSQILDTPDNLNSEKGPANRRASAFKRVKLNQ
jgi:hypothetical protein